MDLVDGLNKKNTKKELFEELPELKPKKPRRKLRYILISLAIFFILLGALFVYKAGATLSIISGKGGFWDFISSSALPVDNYQEDNRTDVLILGIRGYSDPNGGLLSDTIMLLSYKEDTGEVALFSIPRDLYVKIPGLNKNERINFAYAYGEEQNLGGGLDMSRQVVSNVTGINIDYVISVNFDAFKEIIDILGGIEVYVPQDFHEPKQWGGVDFFVQEGLQLMDGTTSLYYARSRYSTSDFDRMRRQQDILFAVKNKALALGVLANPIKINKILESLKNNVRTDMDIMGMKKFIEIIPKINDNDINKKVFDTSTEGMLYSSYINGSYVLLPIENDFRLIRKYVRSIFDEE